MASGATASASDLLTAVVSLLSRVTLGHDCTVFQGRVLGTARV
jgi:hypothetical protein